MTALHQTIDRPSSLRPELMELLSTVETATIGHFEHRGFAGGDILPLVPARIAGTAVTVSAPGRDGQIIWMAVDQIRPGDVLVIARPDRDDIACVGGGVASAAKARGAAGIIIDGPCTDPGEIVACGLPVWCRGVSAKTTNRQFAACGSLDVPVACGSTAVLPGYAVLADSCGVFVAEPQRMQAIAEAAVLRQQQSLALRAHVASGRSIFDFSKDTDK